MSNVDLRRNNSNVVSNKYVPEPGEFTKDFRHTLKLGPKTRNRTARIILKGLEACERLDRLESVPERENPIEYPWQIHLAEKTKEEYYVKLRTLIPDDLFERTRKSVPESKEIERLKAALAIATDYVANESTRTSMGQLYDIEQALKGGE